MKTSLISLLFFCVCFLVSSCELIEDLLEDPIACNSIQAVNTDKQYGATGKNLPAPLQVKVTNDAGNALANVAVTWRVVSGNGTVSQSSTTTNAQGIAEVNWQLGAGEGEQKVTASIAPQSQLCTSTSSVDFTAEVLTLKLTGAEIELFDANDEECREEGEEEFIFASYDEYIDYESNADLSQYYVEVEDQYKFDDGTTGSFLDEGQVVADEKPYIYKSTCTYFGDGAYIDSWFRVRLYQLKDGQKTGEALVTSNKIGPFRTESPAGVNLLSNDVKGTVQPKHFPK